MLYGPSFNEACAANEAIKCITDPYEIIQLVLALPQSQYSATPQDTASRVLANLVHNDVSLDHKDGFDVIRAMLNTMKGLRSYNCDRMGCDFFWRISVGSRLDQTPSIAFVVMRDEIQVAVQHALDKHNVTYQSRPWMIHAHTVLGTIDSTRSLYSKSRLGY